MAGLEEELLSMSKLFKDASEEVQVAIKELGEDEKTEFLGLSKVMEQGPRIGTVEELKELKTLKEEDPVGARVKALLMKIQKEIS